MRGQILDLLQELVGSTKRAQRAAETGVYQLAPWYFVVKVIFVTGSGFFLLYSSFRWGPTHPLLETGLLAAAGVWLMWLGLAILRGPRRIRISNGLLTTEYLNGRQDQYRVTDLSATSPPRWMYIGSAVPVRSRSTGRMIFMVPRDLPGWEVLVAEIEASGAA
jgi:hypothetical protein